MAELRRGISLLELSQTTARLIQRVLVSTFFILLVVVRAASAQLAATPPRLIVETGHTDDIESLYPGPDGTLAITGGKDGSARIWSLETGRELVTLQGNRKEVIAVAFFSDGKTALTASADGTIRLWDVQTGLESLRIDTDSVLNNALISNSGTIFAETEPGGEIAMWGRDGKAARTIQTNIAAIAFTVDNGSRVVAVGGDEGQVRTYDVSTGQLAGEFVGHTSRIRALAFSQDGRFLITSSSPRAEIGEKDFSLRLWDVATHKELHRFDNCTEPVSKIEVVGDSVIGTLEKEQFIRVWDISSGKTQRDIPLSMFPVNFAINPSGTVLLVSSFDTDFPFYVIDFANGRVLRKIAGFGEAVRSVAMSDDYIAVGHINSVSLWSRERGSGRRLNNLFAGATGDSVAFCPQTQALLTATYDGAELWDSATALPKQHFDYMGADKVRFSRTCRYFALASYSGVVVGSSDGKLTHPLASTSMSDDIAFTPDEHSIAVARSSDLPIRENDGGTCVWNLASGDKEKCIGDDQIDVIVSFSPNSRWAVTVNSDGLTKMREIDTGREYPLEAKFEPKVVTFSSDGRLILMAGTGGVAQMWKVGDRNPLATLAGHISTITGGAFSSDGHLIITGSDDGTVRLWNAATFDELCALAELHDGHWIVVDPSGRFDTDAPGEIKGAHWAFPDNLLKVFPLDQYMQLYYEPRLLSRILSGEKLPAVRPFDEINTVVPSVRIVSIKQEEQRKDRLEVRVNISCDAPPTDSTSSKKSPCEAGSLRLFREGQLVDHTLVHLHSSSPVTVGPSEELVFHNVKIPDGTLSIDFSAYALNNDHVKSETAHRAFAISKALRQLLTHDSRTYLITIGVARSGDELIYPSEDARFIQTVLGEKLKRPWSPVVPIALIIGRPDEDEVAGSPEILPTKKNIKAVFEMLAGEVLRPQDIDGIPFSVRKEIHPVGPNDSVIISFSGHGSADAAGNFYLFPYLPFQTSDEMTEADRISGDELASWLEQIDSGNLALILDACQAAGLPGKEFRPAPLGNRGIGQLAYDKGMFILAGTQSTNSAKESGLYRHGLLTYALIQEGLIDDKARTPTGLTLRQWLEFGEGRVPSLYLEAIPGAGGKLQRPYLFDFSRTGDDLVIEGAAN